MKKKTKKKETISNQRDHHRTCFQFRTLLLHFHHVQGPTLTHERQTIAPRWHFVYGTRIEVQRAQHLVLFLRVIR